MKKIFLFLLEVVFFAIAWVVTDILVLHFQITNFVVELLIFIALDLALTLIFNGIFRRSER